MARDTRPPCSVAEAGRCVQLSDGVVAKQRTSFILFKCKGFRQEKSAQFAPDWQPAGRPEEPLQSGPGGEMARMAAHKMGQWNWSSPPDGIPG